MRIGSKKQIICTQLAKVLLSSNLIIKIQRGVSVMIPAVYPLLQRRL